MPHKKRTPEFAPSWYAEWERSNKDECLKTAVFEAIWARSSALNLGVERASASCRAMFRSAETTLDQVRFGRVEGKVAWKKAADALRKYTEATDCISPPQHRRPTYRGLLGHR